MSTHHAQTALRMLEAASGSDAYSEGDVSIGAAVVHAQLEQAAQTERLADAIIGAGFAIERLSEEGSEFVKTLPELLTNLAGDVLPMLLASGIIKFKGFDPENN